MCISAHVADFESTYVSLFETMHPEHGLIQVLGYSNTVQNLANEPNAMIIHFPAKEPMGRENFIDHSAKNIHKDMREAVEPEMRGGMTRGLSFGIPKAIMFDYDVYTVILGQNVSEVVKLLPEVPIHRRPRLKSWTEGFYSQYLPYHNIALFCFNTNEASEAAPVLVWYKPWDVNFMSLPALDSHTGDIPRLRSQVDVDHWIFLGHDRMIGGEPVEYSDDVSNISDYLPKSVIGKHYTGQMRNGDFGYDRKAVVHGNMEGMVRLLPSDYL